MQTTSSTFAAFQVTPAGENYEQEFLSLVASVESHSSHWIAREVVSITKKLNTPIHPVVGFNEFPGLGIGAAVEVSPGSYRAVVIGNRQFLNDCGLAIPETLEVAARKWESEKAIISLAGWDGWVRGILKFNNPQ